MPPDSSESPSSEKLRVGLIVDSVDLDAWEWALVSRLKASPHLELALVVVSKTGPPDTSSVPTAVVAPETNLFSRVIRSVNRMLEHRMPLNPDAFSKKDGVQLFSGIPTTRADLVYESGSYRWSEWDVARFQGYKLDVFVCMEPPIAGAGLASLAKYGLWWLSNGDERSGYGNPAGFWEVFFASPVMVSSVLILSDRYPSTAVACRSFSATDMTSVRRNNNNIYWKTVSLIPRKLEELHRTGPSSFFRRIDASVVNCSGAVNASHAPPTRAQLIAHIGRIARRGLRNRIQEKLYLPQWILLYQFENAVSTRLQEFKKLVPPKACFWADPHVVFRGGKHYVFFEELPFATNKGHICVLEIGENGDCSVPVKVLERPYHLSYPAVFEHEGEFFMVPDTGENRTIELYWCREFPHQWEFVRNIMENVSAVDSTFLRRDGKWWLFANIVENEGGSTWDELFLFYSDSLLNGPWIPHPMNPVVSDVRRARPAGPIFEKRGKIYRPSQDCSVRYGYGIRVNEITRLTTDDYAEIEAAFISPTWDKAITGTHHLSHAHGLTVADALRPRRRI